MHIFLLVLLALPLPAPGPFEGLRHQWAEDLHEKRIDDSVALYTSDAVFIQPDGSRVDGVAAIRKLFGQVTSTFDSTLTFSSKRVERSGDLAYDSGTYTEVLVTRATGKELQVSGSYLTVYWREPHKGWKIVEQMWTGGAGNGPPR